MCSRPCIVLLLFVAACATPAPSSRALATQDPRLTHLQRAAVLPWTDGGQCVVRAASEPWPMLIEQCYQALDHERIQFHDSAGRCTVASADAATMGIGVCVLAAPEVVAGAVVVTGVVVMGFAIKEALDAYELKRDSLHVSPTPETLPEPQTKPSSIEVRAKERTKPEPKAPNVPPLWPPGISKRERRLECDPIPVNHRGGDKAHDKCADQFPPNRYPGKDVLVAGKRFDALQVGMDVLWEIKTDRFGTYSDFLQKQVVQDQIEEMREERDIAVSCGYGFVVGVSTEEHKEALEFQAPELNVVVTGCTR